MCGVSWSSLVIKHPSGSTLCTPDINYSPCYGRVTAITTQLKYPLGHLSRFLLEYRRSLRLRCYFVVFLYKFLPLFILWYAVFSLTVSEELGIWFWLKPNVFIQHKEAPPHRTERERGLVLLIFIIVDVLIASHCDLNCLTHLSGKKYIGSVTLIVSLWEVNVKEKHREELKPSKIQLKNMQYNNDTINQPTIRNFKPLHIRLLYHFVGYLYICLYDPETTLYPSSVSGYSAPHKGHRDR